MQKLFDVLGTVLLVSEYVLSLPLLITCNEHIPGRLLFVVQFIINPNDNGKDTGCNKVVDTLNIHVKIFFVSLLNNH